MGRKSRRSGTKVEVSKAPPKLLADLAEVLPLGDVAGGAGPLRRNASVAGFTLVEFHAMPAATGITVWICKHPMGMPKVYIEEAAQMLGRFESRTNWALVILAAHITLLGIGVAGKIVHDLNNGLTTVHGG